MGEEGSAHEVGLVGEEFEGFGGLDGRGEVDGGGEDAGGVAGFDWAGGWLGEDTGYTGCRVPHDWYVASLRPDRQIQGFFASLRMTTLFVLVIIEIEETAIFFLAR